MVSIEWVVYGIVALIAIIGIVWDVTRFVDNGYFSNKNPGEPGLMTVLFSSIFVSFTLIWGGVFWW